MSFGVSLTGLNGATRELEVRGNNIANVGTTAFKRSRVNFGDLVSTTQANRPGPVPGIGSRVLGIDQQFLQGSFKSTKSVFDLAIDGEGFFVVVDRRQRFTTDQGQINERLFTRNGGFFIDENGFVVDSEGRNLQVATNSFADGQEIGSVSDLRLPTKAGLPRASSLVDLEVNLPADAPILNRSFDRDNSQTYNASTSLRLFDSSGTPLNATVYFSRSSSATSADPFNRWSTHIFINDQALIPNDEAEPVYSFDLAFSTDGQLVSPLNRIEFLPLNVGADIDPMVLSVSFSGGTSQFPSDFNIRALKQDGFPPALLDSIEIDKRGNVIAAYDSGKEISLGRILMARFDSPNSLVPLGDGMFKQYQSDRIWFGYASDGRIGAVQSRALETSNVNLTDELLGLINAQRMFQSNAKAIEAVSDMTRRMTDRA